jgi:hypothetical protein
MAMGDVPVKTISDKNFLDNNFTEKSRDIMIFRDSEKRRHL